MSVLGWWFRDKQVRLNASSLNCDLQLRNNGRQWHLSVEGRMTSCPGYTQVVIQDRDALLELFRYDVLVTCPPTFQLNFRLPNFDFSVDKTFEVTFNDTRSVQRVFLTHVGQRGGGFGVH